jgi:hypothetical protein
LRSFPTIVLIALLALPQVALGQAASQQTASWGEFGLSVSGPAGQSIRLRAHDLAAMAHERINVVDEKGSDITYEGVPIIEILRRVGTPSGKDLRGKQMTLYLLVSASDGYHAVFSLAELDPDFTDRRILLVDRRDGKALSSAEGPFRILVPGEKRHARWVRNVTALAVKTAQ